MYAAEALSSRRLEVSTKALSEAGATDGRSLSDVGKNSVLLRAWRLTGSSVLHQVRSSASASGQDVKNLVAAASAGVVSDETASS